MVAGARRGQHGKPLIGHAQSRGTELVLPGLNLGHAQNLALFWNDSSLVSASYSLPAVAHVHLLTDDLLFGSRLAADLASAGHTVTLGPTADLAADALVADLTHEPDARIALLAAGHPPTLAFFSHVEPGVRERALSAGIEVVVPRSRIAREGPALLAALLATAR